MQEVCWNLICRRLREGHADARGSDQQVPEVGKSEEKMTRRKWFSGKENRDAVKLGKDVYMGMEFCNGLLGTWGGSVSLKLTQHQSSFHSSIFD